MISLRESLEELMEASANKVLADGGTMEGRQALARMALLLELIDRLEANGGTWDDCDLLPEGVPLLSGLTFKPASTLPQ
ncbi:MAG TPA: hypothetical protein VJV23_15770 [Candidatus Polarisedimenticolia bacterium]|nr:hypothetical protein [Candidatus Polarisedimenticolia bacterium]